MTWRYRISYGTHQLEGDQEAVEALSDILGAEKVEHYVHRARLDLEGRVEPSGWRLVR